MHPICRWKSDENNLLLYTTFSMSSTYWRALLWKFRIRSSDDSIFNSFENKLNLSKTTAVCCIGLPHGGGSSRRSQQIAQRKGKKEYQYFTSHYRAVPEKQRHKYKILLFNILEELPTLYTWSLAPLNTTELCHSFSGRVTTFLQLTMHLNK